MKKDKLSSFSFACLLGSPIFSLFSGVGSHNLIHIAGVDAWICVIFSFLIGLFPFALFLYLFYASDEKNILEMNLGLFGNVFGNFLNILINIFLFFVGMVQLFNISNFVISQFLAETPILWFMILFGILIIYNVSFGIENISRVAVIFVGVIIFMTIISTTGLLPTVDTSNLKPYLENGIGTPLRGSILLTLTNVTPIFMLLIIPRKRISDNKNAWKYFTFFYFLAFLFAFLAIVLSIGSLGIYLCQVYQYPEYTVLKKISLFNFIERIENFIYIKWILNSFITLSLVVYHLNSFIKKDSRKVVPISSTILLILGSRYLFQNNTLFYHIGLNIFPYVCLCLFFVYLIIGITTFWKKRTKIIS